MTRLARAYISYNRLYFGSQLPRNVRVKWSPRLDSFGRYGDNLIEIASWQQKHWMIWNLTLLHEMAHVATDSEAAGHGPRWLREMRRLARVGAFDKLW